MFRSASPAPAGTVMSRMEKLLPMPERSADFDDPEQRGPISPLRVVAEWEYKTAYIPTFQIRFSLEMKDRLSDWARQEGKLLDALLIEILEKAIHRRGKP
jgi:hypothetical protein